MRISLCFLSLIVPTLLHLLLTATYQRPDNRVVDSRGEKVEEKEEFPL